MNFKEKLTLRNVVIWSASFLGLITFILSFFVTSKIASSVGQYIVLNSIWSATKVDAVVEGVPQGTSTMSVGHPFALPIIGIILILVSSIAGCAVSLLVKNKKYNKIIYLCCGVLAITGGIFVFFVSESGLRSLIYSLMAPGEDYAKVKAEFLALGGTAKSGALGIIVGIFGILIGVAQGVSQFLPEKKLVK